MISFFKKSIFLVLILVLLSPSTAHADVADATPIGAPQSVDKPTAVLIADTTDVTVTWTKLTDAQSSGSPVTGYQAVPYYGSGFTTLALNSCSTGATGDHCTVSGLAFGVTYQFKVLATNSNGTSTSVFSDPVTAPLQTQTVSITGAPTSYTYGSADFKLAATATSGLAVAWTASPSATCTVDSDGFVHFKIAGTCRVTATQSGAGSSYSSASSYVDVSAGISLSVTIGSASNVQGTTASVSATFPYPGESVTPSFCVSTSNSASTSCSLPGGVSIGSPSPALITASSSNAVSADITGLTANTTYYFWAIASASSPAVASSTSSFTTISGPSITATGTNSGTVNSAFTMTFTASGGSGDYVTWDKGTLPAGLTFTPGVNSSTLTGTPTAAATTPTWVSVTDSGGLSTTYSYTITIAPVATTAPTTPTTPVTTPSGPSGQVITVTNLPDPAFVGDSDLQLDAVASSGLPISYQSTTSKICTISMSGLLKIITIGNCLLTLSQAGNSSYNPATKSVIIKVVHKLQVALEEFTNVQSNSATAVATAPWPSDDVSVKFCISLSESKSDCTVPSGVSISDLAPTTITKDSGSVVTANISGLNPATNYFVWAVATVGDEEVTSGIRKLHTPVGPTILYAGKTSYLKTEPVRIQFRATGGAGGFKNWKGTGFPTGIKLVALNSTFTATGTNLKAGTYIVSVSVADKSGSTSTITVPLVISGGVIFGQPEQVQGAIAQLISSKSVRVSWQPQDDAQKYEVTLANKVVCSTSGNECEIKQLLGPKAQIAVTAVSTEGIKSQPIPTTYRAPVIPIDMEVANFALNSAVLSASDKSKIASLAKTIQTQGFTSIQVAGHTDSQGNASLNSALSRARAVNTFTYLKQILAKTPISVTLLAEGASSPVRSNATTEGRAANRRAVLSLN